MALIKTNPEAEVSLGFSAVKAGTYRMRIVEVRDRNPEKNDLEIKLAFVQPASELLGVDNMPLKGQAGNLFDYIMLAADKQWKFRAITEAAGLLWNDYDPVVDLPQCEVDAVVKVELYEGEQRNKIARYIVPKK